MNERTRDTRAEDQFTRDVRELFAQPGQSLDDATRAWMEERFGTSFCDVRIHSGAAATALLERAGALGLVAGGHIAIANDVAAAAGPLFRYVLAHELAHVVQNRACPEDGDEFAPSLEPALSRAEREADRVARNLGAGLPAGPIAERHRGIALTAASDAIEALVAYGSNLYLDAHEERLVLNHLRRDTSIDLTIAELIKDDLLDNLLARISPENRLEFVQVLGGKIPNAMMDMVLEGRFGAWDRNFKMPPPRGNNSSRGTWTHVYDVSRDLQSNIKRLGLVTKAAGFTASAFAGAVGGKDTSPFSGSGATGVNPSTLEVDLYDSWKLWRGDKSTVSQYSNPIPGDLRAYLAGLTAAQRIGQAKLLMGLPISTVMYHSYIGWIPSRKQITEGAAKVHNLHPQLVAAFLLAEQRDQSANEDAKDFDAAVSMTNANTSIGLGQIVISTAVKHDLFADLLSPGVRKGLRHDEIAYLLASDEFNIFGAARYIRLVADQGAKLSIGSLPNTLAKFPGISMPDYAKNSALWPDDNIRALGSEYTSTAWDDSLSPGWGQFVFEAYQDLNASGVF
jgi:hypothetical protein